MNSLILFLFLYMIIENKNRFLLPSTNRSLQLKIDIKHTREKVKLIKKIGPYFPEEHLPSINRAIGITEKIIRLYEVMEFMQINEFNYIEKSIAIENNRERLNYIANVIEKEFSKDQIKEMGKTVDIILKIDKFNKMMNMMNLLMENQDRLNDKDSMLKLIEQFAPAKDEKERKKIKDMMKMLDVLKALDSPKKSNEESKNS